MRTASYKTTSTAKAKPLFCVVSLRITLHRTGVLSRETLICCHKAPTSDGTSSKVVQGPRLAWLYPSWRLVQSASS
eukprot:3864915-Rhodomonas_salina.2